MSEFADPRSIAVHLAAALISSGQLENGKGAQVVAVVKTYFDVLDAVVNEQSRRFPSPTPVKGR
jgi:hypothetical protein